jgi:hypothetical protein
MQIISRSIVQDGIIQSDLIQLNIKKPQQGKLGPRRKGERLNSVCMMLAGLYVGKSTYFAVVTNLVTN